MNPRVTVSQLRYASESFELLKRSLAGEPVWKTVEGFRGGDIPGSLFHDRVAAPLFAALHEGAEPECARRIVAAAGACEPVARALRAALHAHHFEPLLRADGPRLGIEQVIGLASATDRLAVQLAEALCALPPARTPADVAGWVLPPERTHRAELPLASGALDVIGRFDAALFDARAGRVLVVELKCHPGTHAVKDLLQLAVYAWLLRQSTGLPVDGALFFLGDGGGTQRHASAELAALVESRETRAFLDEVRAVVAKRAPRSAKRGAARAAPAPDMAAPNIAAPAPAPHLAAPGPAPHMAAPGPAPHLAAPGPAPHEAAPAPQIAAPAPHLAEAGSAPHLAAVVAAQQQVAALVGALAKLKCKVTALEPIVGPRVIRCRVVPQLPHTTVARLERQGKDLQVLLGLESVPAIQGGSGFVSIDLPRPSAPPVYLEDVLAQGGGHRPRSAVAFPLGVAIDGRVHWADMADPSMTSILVGGTAGSGKSEFLKAAVVAMALGATPAQVQFTLVDPKLVTFTALKSLPHLARPLITDASGVLEALKWLVAEMERRYRALADAGVDHIGAFTGLGHHVLLIDEFADLMAAKASRAELEECIARLGAKGRAAGIHLVLATQHPSVKVISPLIKANLQLKVALRVATGKNSEVVLDARGAEALLGKGDLLVGGPIAITRLQGAIVTGADVRRALATR